MTQRIAYYQIMTGLPGCLPNSHEFREFRTRRDMVKGIDEILDWHGFPMRSRRQVNTVEAWRYIQNGGRKAHFTLHCIHSPDIIEFVQINRAEYETANEESF